MNKRALRKFAAPGHHFDLNNGLLHLKSVRHLVRTAVKNIAGRRTLILYFYSTEALLSGGKTPRYTVFQLPEDFLTLEHRENDATMWRTAQTQSLENGVLTDKSAFYSLKDEQRVSAFCKASERTGFSALRSLQSGIRDTQAIERQKKRERKILQRMEVLPALPRGLKSWVDRTVLPHYLFYTYNKRRREMDGYCTACKRAVSISGARHNSSDHCPYCCREITFKSRGKRGHICDRLTVQVLQRISDKEVIVRFFKVVSAFSAESEKARFSIYESARIFVFLSENGNAVSEHYYCSFNTGLLTPWHKGDRPVYSRYQYYFDADCCGYLYDRNLEEALASTPWQYSQLKEYYQGDPTPLFVPRYLKHYLQYPMLEYLVKLGFYRLATFAVYGENGLGYGMDDPPLNKEGKSPEQILRVPRSCLSFLREIDPTAKQLLIFRQLLQSGKAPSREFLQWCGENDIGKSEDIEYIRQYMTEQRMMRYLSEQFELFRRTSPYQRGHLYSSMGAILTDYKDYLWICRGIDSDMKNSFVLFPKNLPEAHDRVMKLTDNKTAIYSKFIENAHSELQKRYHFKRTGLLIVAPKTAGDIVKEGQALHHCVANFVKSVALGEKTVLFIRKAEAPEEPYCTVELIGNSIRQARIKNNAEPSAQVKKFLSVWEKKVLAATPESDAA